MLFKFFYVRSPYFYFVFLALWNGEALPVDKIPVDRPDLLEDLYGLKA